MSDRTGEKHDPVSKCKDAAKSLACHLEAKMDGALKICSVVFGECEVIIES